MDRNREVPDSYHQVSEELIAMKKMLIPGAVFGAIVLFASGCHMGVKGSGLRRTEKRDVGSFSAIDVSGMLHVEVTCQKPVSLEIEGDDNLLSLIQTEVVNNVLQIKSTKNYHSREPIVVRLSVPSLDRIESTGATRVRVSDLKNDRFEIHSSGVVNVSATGQTKTLEIDETGAGTIDTHNLRAQSVSVSVSGAAGVDVYASEQLDVTVSGAAHVTYSGDPTVRKNVSGAGSVNKKEARGV